MTVRRVAVTFALPDEGRDFVELLKNRSRGRGSLAPVRGELTGCEVTVAFTGVGSGRDCRRRLESALNSRPDYLIASGFAGGLRADLAVGDLMVGENHSDPGLVERAMGALDAIPVRRGALTTQPLLAETLAAKAILAAQTNADAVDMETEWIAEACARAGTPMLSLRVISDAADQAFPAPGHVLFDAVRQRPRYVRLPLWLLAHPGQIAPFVHFVRALAPARQKLAEALQAIVSDSVNLRQKRRDAEEN